MGTRLIILGIDPGLNGAFALYDPVDNRLRTLPMPIVQREAAHSRKGRVTRELDLHRLAVWFQTQGQHITLAVLERVSARPGQGVSSMFKFGQGLGQLEMAVIMAGIPLHYITPQTWRKETRTPKGKDGSLLQARNMFPDQALDFSRRADEGKAEAALIAWAGAKIYVPGAFNKQQKPEAEEIDPFA